MAPKVFISHSAKSKEHLALRDQLVAELKKGEVDTWVDAAQLKVGDDWLKRITEGLGDCYAGIILFSSDALNSDFVKYEVSCLAQRKRMHSGFGLFALNLGDVDLKTIGNGFYGSIRFPDLQIKDFHEGCSEVVDAVKALQPPELTPTRQLEGELLEFLPVGSRETLRVIAKKRGWLVSDKLGDKAERLHFVRMLVSQAMEEQVGVLTEIMGGLRAGYDVRELFDKLEPSWVDEAAALQLDAVRSLPDGKRGALVNGEELGFTCNAFLRRANPAAGVGLRFHTAIPKGRQALQRLTRQIRESLSQQLTVTIPKGSTPEAADDAVNQKLARIGDIVRPVQVLKLEQGKLPMEGLLALLKALQNRFPKVTFIAMTGTGDFPEFEQPLEDNVTLVTPALSTAPDTTHHNESYAKRWYDDGCDTFEALK